MSCPVDMEGADAVPNLETCRARPDTVRRCCVLMREVGTYLRVGGRYDPIGRLCGASD